MTIKNNKLIPGKLYKWVSYLNAALADEKPIIMFIEEKKRKKNNDIRLLKVLIPPKFHLNKFIISIHIGFEKQLSDFFIPIEDEK